MPGASYSAVTGEARPGRILLAEQQVLSDRSAGSSTDTSATSCRTRRVGPGVAPRASHRSVRAQLRHTARLNLASLRQEDRVDHPRAGRPELPQQALEAIPR